MKNNIAKSIKPKKMLPNPCDIVVRKPRFCASEL